MFANKMDKMILAIGLVFMGIVFVVVNGFKIKHTDNYELPNVKVSLYYETMCPDCKDWTKNQLCPVVEKLSKYFYIDFVPYGNARTEVNNETGEINITCQHGPDECEGNRACGCALQHLSYLQSTRFICCMENERDFQPQGQKCLKKLGIDIPTIVDCTIGPDGQHLHYLNGLKTQKLKPSPDGVPWIIFNDQYKDDEEMEAARDNFLSVLCKYIPPPKPVECNALHWIDVKLIT